MFVELHYDCIVHDPQDVFTLHDRATRAGYTVAAITPSHDEKTLTVDVATLTRERSAQSNDSVARIIFGNFLENSRILRFGDPETTLFGAKPPVTAPYQDDPDCPTCQRKEGGPSHTGSAGCRSNSIASSGTSAHCSCDTCY